MTQLRMYAGAEWVASVLHRPLSPFEASVADILGGTFRGVYHMGEEAITGGTWSEQEVSVRCWPSRLSTYDSDDLTVLVVLAHDACVRLEVLERPFDRLRVRLDDEIERDLEEKVSHDVVLRFTPRAVRTGGAVWDRHPTIEAAIAQIRERVARLQPHNEPTNAEPDEGDGQARGTAAMRLDPKWDGVGGAE